VKVCVIDLLFGTVIGRYRLGQVEFPTVVFSFLYVDDIGRYEVSLLEISGVFIIHVHWYPWHYCIIQLSSLPF